MTLEPVRRPASVAQMRAAASNEVFASPQNLKEHPLTLKVCVAFNGSSGTPVIIGTPENVASVVSTGTGQWTVNFSVTLAAGYSIGGITQGDPALAGIVEINHDDVNAVQATSVRLMTFNLSAGNLGLGNHRNVHITIHGQLA